MEKIIDIENILINQNASSWEEAIEVAATPLVNCGSIKKEYILQMIESVKTLGPYIVIMPSFALAHAAPSSAVNKSDISIATFSNGINFHTENDPVKIVLCLACTDKTSHLDKMQKLATVLMDETIIDKICECKDANSLYELINKDII